jgi:hypothetical protein
MGRIVFAEHDMGWSHEGLLPKGQATGTDNPAEGGSWTRVSSCFRCEVSSWWLGVSVQAPALPPPSSRRSKLTGHSHVRVLEPHRTNYCGSRSVVAALTVISVGWS